MVSLLKNKTSGSVREELLHYTHKLIGVIILLIIASIGFYSLTASSAARENDQLFLVNDFFTNLQENKNLLYDAVTNQDASSCPEIILESENLLTSLNSILKLNISLTFNRDILDLIGIMENYQNELLNVQQLLLNHEKMDQISQSYYNVEHMYSIMNSSFHSIYSQVAEACRFYADRSMKLCVCYTIILVITVTLILYDLFLRVRKIESSISLPIQQMIEELKNLDLENFQKIRQLHVSPNSNDDIQLLIYVYNSMLEKIQKQLLEHDDYLQTRLKLKEQELNNLQISNQLKKSQLLNLQTQINPHFLFNTLNMISQSAYMENDRHTVSLLETTSDLLRYALDYSDKSVSLAQEIKHLGDYVYLQEQRFGKRIRFYFDLDESFHQTQIPNLILQPILENSIVHGVGMYTEGGKIMIQTKYLPDRQMGRISIIDNGEGMDTDTLKRIDKQMRSRNEGTGKIGLSNVFFRLSIFFDQNADIILTSLPRQRTEVAIYIPCQTNVTEVNTDVSSYYC